MDVSPRQHSLPTRGPLPGARGIEAQAPWPTMVANALQIDLATLGRFWTLMAEQGHALEAARLFFDPIYAYRRIALAHTSNDDALKALALELFECYKRLEQRRHTVSAFQRPH